MDIISNTNKFSSYKIQDISSYKIFELAFDVNVSSLKLLCDEIQYKQYKIIYKTQSIIAITNYENYFRKDQQNLTQRHKYHKENKENKKQKAHKNRVIASILKKYFTYTHYKIVTALKSGNKCANSLCRTCKRSVNALV